MHVIGLITKGHVLGLEEAIIGKSEFYQSTALCVSQQVDLLRIDKETFINILKTTSIWHDLK